MGRRKRRTRKAENAAALFSDRLREKLSDEAKNEACWWWLSFVKGEGASEQFAGACVVKAPGFVSAVGVVNSLGINPGGQVAGWPIPEAGLATIPEDTRNRLLSKEDCVEKFDGKRLGDLRKEGYEV